MSPSNADEDSVPPTSDGPTRRAFLAVCGVTATAGCSDLVATGQSDPPVECGPAEYAWPTYGYDSERTGHVPDRELPPEDAETARFSRTGTDAGANGGGSVDAPPVVGDGVAYVAGDTRVEARDVETGERLWETDPDDGVSTSPTLACGAVYVATLNETLALDAEDGTVLWRTDRGTGTGASESPTAVDDTLFVVGNGGVTALDAETGDERWRGRIDHAEDGLAVADRVYVAGGSNGGGEVAAFTRDGTEWWRTTEVGEVYTAPVVADGTVFAVSKTGTLTALDSGDGSVRWQASVAPGVYEPPAVADGRVFVAAGNGRRATALDARTGEQIWRFETGVSQGAPTVVGDRVLLTGANTGVHALDAETGERVAHWPVESVGSRPVVADGRLFYRAWNVSDAFVVG